MLHCTLNTTNIVGHSNLTYLHKTHQALTSSLMSIGYKFYTFGLCQGDLTWGILVIKIIFSWGAYQFLHFKCGTLTQQRQHLNYFLY